jgi:curved DNA-binding protein
VKYNDYYKIKDLERIATLDEIKRAHCVLARKYRPDVSKAPNVDARFKEIGEAYEVLTNPERRMADDQLCGQWKHGQEFRSPPDWSAGHESASKGFAKREAAEYSDFFEALFRRGVNDGRAHHERQLTFKSHGADSQARIQIDLEEAYQSGQRRLKLGMQEMDGQGRVNVKDHEIEFNIPKGVRAGQRIRLVGQGGPGMGELYLEASFKPHAHYRIDKHDVYLDFLPQRCR